MAHPRPYTGLAQAYEWQTELFTDCPTACGLPVRTVAVLAACVDDLGRPAADARCGPRPAATSCPPTPACPTYDWEAAASRGRYSH